MSQIFPGGVGDGSEIKETVTFCNICFVKAFIGSVERLDDVKRFEHKTEIFPQCIELTRTNIVLLYFPLLLLFPLFNAANYIKKACDGFVCTLNTEISLKHTAYQELSISFTRKYKQN